jgi:hypothetical protein
MFGNLGYGELINILLFAAVGYGIPLALVVWIIRQLLRNARKQDEILARLVALEERRDRSDRVP